MEINDLTSLVQLLGNPFTKATFAKNVWDMQTYNGRIYLGHGDFNNSTGPIPVIYYDPTNNKFVTQYTVNEEEICQFKVLNGILFIPGTDAREDWSYGNFYTLENNGQWTKHRTIPNANHVFDMAYSNGQLYAAAGTTRSGWGEVLTTKDMGITWSSVMPANMMFPGAWATALFDLNSKLYAAGKMFFYPASAITGSIAKYTNVLGISRTTSAPEQYTTRFAPGISLAYTYYIQRTATVNNQLVYCCQRIAASHWLPHSMYVAASLNQSRKVIFPEGSAIPSDLAVRDNHIYVLAFIRKAACMHTNIIYHSTDLHNWTELFRFDTDTFARSFEELNGDFYFGLGCDTVYLAETTGNILKVSSGQY